MACDPDSGEKALLMDGSAIRERIVVKRSRNPVTTGDSGEIHVRDNGSVIPKDIRGKLFQPFFMDTEWPR
jgi:C4-dicarboxylate-specific signal transduction histidine kinase